MNLNGFVPTYLADERKPQEYFRSIFARVECMRFPGPNRVKKLSKSQEESIRLTEVWQIALPPQYALSGGGSAFAHFFNGLLMLQRYSQPVEVEGRGQVQVFGQRFA